MSKRTLSLVVIPVFMLLSLFMSFASQAREIIFFPERIKNIDAEEEATSYALIKFDLSPIPQRAIIRSAVLYLRTNETAKEYRLRRVDKSWINIDATKPNKESHFFRKGKSGTLGSAGYITWSVGEDVVLWISKNVPNYGWGMSFSDGHGNSFLRAFDIRLVVNYSTIDLTIISAENIAVNTKFSAEDIRRGFYYFQPGTLVKVICNTKWQVTAKITPINWPEKGTIAPILNALEVRASDSDEWLAGGGVIKTGSATGEKGEVFFVICRLNLTRFEEISSGSTFLFRITFSGEEL